MSEQEETKENDGAIFEPLYLRERQKSKYLLTSTIILSILFLGALVINPAAESATQVGRGQGGGGMGRQGMSITTFFNEDGSLNQDQVDRVNSVPAERKEAFAGQLGTQIAGAVSDGTITTDQATALKKALGLE